MKQPSYLFFTASNPKGRLELGISPLHLLKKPSNGFHSEFESFDEIESAPTQWMWQPFIPIGALISLEGAPGSGKTTIICDIAARVSSGRPFPSEEEGSTPSKVLIIGSEDSAATTLGPRFTACGGIRANILKLKVHQKEWSISDLAERIEYSATHKGVRLAIIDGIGSYLSAPNNEKKTRAELQMLAEIAQTHQITILIIRHLSKTEGKAINRGLGSIALSGIARVVLTVGTHPQQNGQRVMAAAKSNVSDMQSITFRLEEVTVQTASGITTTTTVDWLNLSDISADELTAVQSPKEAKIEIAMKFLFGYLKEGPKQALEVEEEAQSRGISLRTLQRAKALMDVRSFSDRNPHDPEKKNAPSFWRLP